MNSQELVVKKARNGNGIFTTRPALPHTILFEIKGKRIPWQKLLKIGGTILDNCFRFGPETYLSPEGHIGVFQNHSCEPNSGVVKKNGKLFVVSISAIKKNSEILIDYSTITGNDDIWRMRCNCGSKRCRKIIKNISSLPSELQARYLNLGIIPSYIYHS